MAESNSTEKDRIYLGRIQRIKSKSEFLHLGNDKLRNRIYHVKKEIKYLKRLKRILIQRLLHYNDRFMDACLEIPDNEPGSNVEDQIIAEVAQSVVSSAQQSTKRRTKPDSKKAPERPLPSANSQLVAEAVEASEELNNMAVAAKISVSSIIDSVISESRAARGLGASETPTPEQPTAMETDNL